MSPRAADCGAAFPARAPAGTRLPRSSTRRGRATRRCGSPPRSAAASDSHPPRSRSRSAAPRERQRPVVAQHREPAAERPGHDRRERPRPRHELEPQLVAVARDRRRPRSDPCAHRTTGSSPARQSSAGRSPPGPFRCGSTTCSVKPAATAASNALPPCSSTAIPAADASQCVDATMPKVPRARAGSRGSSGARRCRPPASPIPAPRPRDRRGGRRRVPRRRRAAPGLLLGLRRGRCAIGHAFGTAPGGGSSGFGRSPSRTIRARGRCIYGSGTTRPTAAPASTGASERGEESLARPISTTGRGTSPRHGRRGARRSRGRAR